MRIKLMNVHGVVLGSFDYKCEGHSHCDDIDSDPNNNQFVVLQLADNFL